MIDILYDIIRGKQNNPQDAIINYKQKEQDKKLEQDKRIAEREKAIMLKNAQHNLLKDFSILK